MGPKDELHRRVEASMTNHAPENDAVIDAFEGLREYAKAFAHAIVDFCPPSREQSIALTEAESSLMWAVKAIALRQSEVS